MNGSPLEKVRALDNDCLIGWDAGVADFLQEGCKVHLSLLGPVIDDSFLLEILLLW